jgi:hypothetical protein
MKKQILYVTALNEQGILVKANDAEKTGKYSCPICNNELILKKSGNLGKGSKRPHFAHHHLTEYCTPETALHYSFKKMLLENIKKCIDSKIPIDMIWACNYCHGEHKGNLLKKVADVKDEYYMNVCKPDIALFDEKGKVFAVVEVVVTHRPEENVIKYYHDNNIILIQIELDSENDLDNIDEKIKKPSIVDCCLNPKCQICGEYMIKKDLIVLNEHCCNCGNSMKVCYIKTDLGYKTPFKFNEYEINFAKSKDVLLEIRFHKIENKRYLAHICPNCKTSFDCNASFGDWFLSDDIIIESVHDENIPKYDMGYYCYKCNKYKIIGTLHDRSVTAPSPFDNSCHEPPARSPPPHPCVIGAATP